jgi:hypothetical protein
VSTQILDAQTDALLGELGIGNEPTDTPLPPIAERSDWTAVGREMDSFPRRTGTATQQMDALSAREVAQAEGTEAEGAALRRDLLDRELAEVRKGRDAPMSGGLAAGGGQGDRPEALLGLPGIASDTGGAATLGAAGAGTRGSNAIWLATVAALLAVLGVVSWKTGLLTGEFRASRTAAAKAKAIERATAARPKTAAARYGTVEIGASSDNAKVLMLVGKTPVDLPHVDTGVTQELRVEHDGQWPQVALVLPALWKGSDKAELAVTLVPHTKTRPVDPKAPPGESPTDKYGTLHVTATPDGASVWLLVGFTPTMRMEGVRADKDYSFLIVAEHHLPQAVTLKQSEWKDDGVRLTFRSDSTLLEDPSDPIPVIHVKEKAKPKTQTLRF